MQAALKHPKSAGLSDNQIAKHVGVHHDTVRESRLRLEASCGIRKIEERTVTRGGTTYQQNTTNIGRKASLAQPEEQPICGGRVAGSLRSPAITELPHDRRCHADESETENNRG